MSRFLFSPVDYSVDLNIKQAVLPIDQPAAECCVHRGSQRRCCELLWICKKHARDCTPVEAEISVEVIRCSQCSDFETRPQP